MERRLIVGKRSDGQWFIRYTNGLDYIETHVPYYSLIYFALRLKPEEAISYFFPIDILPEPLKEGIVGK